MTYYEKNKDKICFLIPTFLAATHALNCYKSVKKYYPDIPVFFVDDEYTDEAHDIFVQTYMALAPHIYDPDSTKIMGLPGSAYIRVPHEGRETEGHGNAITKAMKFIHHKWIVHICNDVRLIKEGYLEYAFSEIDDKYCGVGINRDNDLHGWPNVAKFICLYRGDLYHKYHCTFEGGAPKWGGDVDAGTIMFRDLVAKGYKMMYHHSDIYWAHLRPDYETWKYYIYD